MHACSISACFSPWFTCRRSYVSLQPIWSSRAKSLFFSFSGMNNIPRAGERAYQEANGKGREIEASVTDKIVAQLVFLTAPWAGERENKCTIVSGKTAACTHKHTNTHTERDRPHSIEAPEGVQRED